MTRTALSCDSRDNPNDRIEERIPPAALATAQLVDDAAEERRIIDRFALQLPQAIAVQLADVEDETADDDCQHQHSLCGNRMRSIVTMGTVVATLVIVSIATMALVKDNGLGRAQDAGGNDSPPSRGSEEMIELARDDLLSLIDEYLKYVQDDGNASQLPESWIPMRRWDVSKISNCSDIFKYTSK